MDKTWFERLQTILRDRQGVSISGDEVRCNECLWSVNATTHRKSFKRFTIRHFSSSEHETRTKWRLVNKSEDEYITISTKPLRTLSHFLTRKVKQPRENQTEMKFLLVPVAVQTLLIGTILVSRLANRQLFCMINLHVQTVHH